MSNTENTYLTMTESDSPFNTSNFKVKKQWSIGSEYYITDGSTRFEFEKENAEHIIEALLEEFELPYRRNDVNHIEAYRRADITFEE